MLIIDRKDNETIDRALKRYKNKHRRTKMRQELNSRKYFTKPSEKRREEFIAAAYKLKKQLGLA